MRTALVPAAALLCALALPAYAQEPKAEAAPDGRPVQIGAGLVCDTKDQVVRYVQLFQGDPEGTVNEVNKEAGQPEACSFGVVAFQRGDDVGEARGKDNKRLRIAEILVVGVATRDGLKGIVPVRWYTLFPAQEQDFEI